MTLRRTLACTFALSLLLHATVAAVLHVYRSSTSGDGPGSRPPVQTVELWFEAEPSPAQPPPAPPEVAPAERTPVRKQAADSHATAEAAPPDRASSGVRGDPSSAPGEEAAVARAEPASPPPHAAAEPPASSDPSSTSPPELLADAPRDPGPPPRLNLLPRTSASDVPVHGQPGGTGRTLYPDDPSFSAEVRQAEEAFRVGQRVGGWANDAAAEGRAQFGGHPYLGAVGDALRAGLGSEDGGTPAALGSPGMLEKMARRWTSAAEQFAKTGNPNLGPPGIAPRQTERQKELFGNEPAADGIRALSQATETMEDLRSGVPLLTLTLELRQAPDGGLISQKVLESSGSQPFDAFVLKVVPQAIAAAGPPPDEVLRGRESLRSVWRIEGWPGGGKGVLSHLPRPGMYGIPLDDVKRQITGDHRPFDFRARVLRVY